MPEPEDKPEVEEDVGHTVIDHAPAAPEPPRKKKRLGLRFGLAAVIALVLIGAGLWLAPIVQETLPGFLPVAGSRDPDPLVVKTASQVERLKNRLAALEETPPPTLAGGESAIAALSDRIDALEARPAPDVSVEPSNERVENLIARLDRLESQLESIDRGAGDQESESKAALDGFREDLAAMNEKLARLQDAPKVEGDFVGAAFFVAVGELRRRIDRGEAYRTEFARLEALTHQGRALDPATASYLSILSKHAESGVATLALLQESYAAVADAVIEGAAPAKAGIWQRAWQSIAGVVKVRRVGEVEGDTADAIVARAQARLDEGNVAGAVEEMAGLRQPSEPAASWIKAAVAYLQTRDALDALEQRGFWREEAS